MASDKANRACLLVVPVLFLLGCSLSGLISPAGDAQETPTGSALGAGGDSDNSGAGGGGSGNTSSVLESVPYGIYVGGVFTGAQCGPYTNSGGLINLDFDSEFHKIVFARPTKDSLPGPYGGLLKEGAEFKAPMADLQVSGTGKIFGYNICPMFETETDSYPSKVTEGPNPFPVHISIVSPQGMEGFEITPIASTPTVTGGGKAVIKFQIGTPEGMRAILRWDGKIGTGEFGGIGGAVVAYFTTTWDQLMQGEEFAFEYIVVGEDGESWHWSIRFLPEPA
jgi:hypothetical protein